MSVVPPINFKKWIEDNRHLLKPPVGNQVVFIPQQDFIVMVVGGPNSRKDYHFNDTEEFFYQLEGDITVKIVDDGKFVDIPVKEGEVFVLPARTPHSPQRGPGTIGLVMEVKRREGMVDRCMWFCEKCGNKLFEKSFTLDNIVTQLPEIMNAFYADLNLRTCKNCGTVMQPPAKPATGC